MLCVIAPFCLAFLLLVEQHCSKLAPQSPLAQKEYYWLKLPRSNNWLVEDNCLFTYRFFTNFYALFIGLLIILEANELGICNLNMPSQNVLGEAFFAIISLLISVLAGLGLVLANKKKFYLGIDAQDVVKNSYIPMGVVNLFVNTVYLLGGYLLCNIAVSDKWEIVLDIAKWGAGVAICYAIVYLLIIIQQMIQLCLSVDRHELGVFRCFRRRIVDIVKIDDSQSISALTVEKIASYLLGECIKQFTKSKTNINQLTSVSFYSVLVDKDRQKNRKKLLGRANCLVTVFSVGFVFLAIGYAWSSGRGNIWIGIIALFLVVVIDFYGYKKETWLIVINSRYYFALSSSEGEKTYDYIAQPYAKLNWRKRFEALSLVEDLFGFYKMLLYNKCGRKYRHNVIRQVLELMDDQNEKICCAILLLLYYTEYEKVFLQLEDKRNQTNLDTKNLLYLNKNR